MTRFIKLEDLCIGSQVRYGYTVYEVLCRAEHQHQVDLTLYNPILEDKVYLSGFVGDMLEDATGLPF